MRIKSLHKNYIMPTLGSNGAGAYDIYMPEDGGITNNEPTKVGLGFAAEVPAGNIALILPRSSIGTQFGLELNNTCGVIDSDYRGEWKAVLKTKSGKNLHWVKGDRLLQFLIIPVTLVCLETVDELSATARGTGGFGSTGK